MSQQLISRSPDLKRLRDDGYSLEVRNGFLLVKDIPYVNSQKQVCTGTLVTVLTLSGDLTATPGDHVIHFIGEYPCGTDGKEIDKIRNQDAKNDLGNGLVVDRCFSAKPKPSGAYADYFEKITTYVAILSGPAMSIDPKCTARTYQPVVANGEDVFKYIDTASSRAEIDKISPRLAIPKIGIIGLGGTGSYVLDLVSKTHVKEIHLFDGDDFLQHNAFRTPGAASIEELNKKLKKVEYLERIYSKMRTGIVPHPAHVDETNCEELRDMTFVFLCLDDGAAKRFIVKKLEEFDLPFIDVGMGLYLGEDGLGGTLRVTTSVTGHRDAARARIPFSDGGVENEYAKNIQVADLNALNAALAVLKWKKLFAFYFDAEREHHSAYTIELQLLTKEDQST